jgi:hypothetical protein
MAAQSAAIFALFVGWLYAAIFNNSSESNRNTVCGSDFLMETCIV